jgi:hypothetical protein
MKISGFLTKGFPFLAFGRREAENFASLFGCKLLEIEGFCWWLLQPVWLKLFLIEFYFILFFFFG